jgi:NADPH:quinone reductase
MNMEKMQAVEIIQPGGPDVLQWSEFEKPRPETGQILIKVKAAGVNRPDILQRQGNYAPPSGASPIPGLEVAGEVVALGEGVTRYKLGDEVCALVPGGGYAEYCAVAEINTLPIPGGMTLTEAAGLPETYFTVWTNVFQRGRLKAGETFLVHGGSSGIGTTAIQLAKAFGAKIIATAGTEDKCEACRTLGADLAINYRDKDFVEELKTRDIKPDVILDMVGGSYIQRNIQVANRDARIVQIAFQQGSKVEVDLMHLMLKRVTLTGSTLRPRTIFEKAEIARDLETQVWPLLAKGLCRPLIYKTFPLASAAEAHRLMESSEHTGKIILTA